MANVADKVRQIRQAIYGRDVRESIASGIEAINAEVENTTSRQNVIDANEDQRKRNETARIKEKYLKEYLINLSMINYLMHQSFTKKYISYKQATQIGKIILGLKKMAITILKGLSNDKV